jgi:hypothetical protein
MASGDTATDSTALDAPVVDSADTSLKQEEHALDNGTVTARCTTICSSTSLSIDSFPASPKKISFGSVNIRTHQQILGDNPAVSQGLPLALAWEKEDSMSYSLDEHEIIRETKPRKSLRISDIEREAALRELGHSSGSFSRVTQEIFQIKSSRQEVKQAQKEEKKKQHALEEYQLLANCSLKEYRQKRKEEIEQSTNESPSNSKDGNQEDSQKRGRRRLLGRWMKKKVK